MYPSGMESISKCCSCFLHFCQNLVECLCDFFDVLSSIFVVLINLLLVGLNGGFNGKELVIGLGIHLVTPFWHFETCGRNSGNIWRRWALVCK